MGVHQFLVSTRWSADGPVVRVAGELDIATAPRFREAVHRALEGRSRRLILDVEDLDFIDSTALGVIVSAVKGMAARDGAVAVLFPSRSILRVLEMTGLADRVEITTTDGSGGPAPRALAV
jgi:anti-sigma B factor antagonist